MGHNIVSDASGGLTGTGDLNNTNPLLAALASNGGPTQTHAPLPGSPAINGVPVANCTDANGIPITTDQRGIARPQGVACDIGSVERVNPTGTPCFQVLKSFAVVDGRNPLSGLIQGVDGALYGTTYLGASNDDSGTVFKMDLDGTGFTVLKVLDTPTTGGRPIAGLIQGTDGALYGTTCLGGSSGGGTLFKLNPNGTGFTVLHHFVNATTGSGPDAELVQGTDGALYGAAYYGGTNGAGTVFKLNPDGTGFTVLKHFDNTATGGNPYGGMIQGVDGALYGTASGGGSFGYGTVFKLNTDGSGFAVLKHFDNATSGNTPYAGLMQGVDAALYGTTYLGGSHGDGTVFKLNPDGSGFAVIKHLDSSTTGANPLGELIQGSDGALYGTLYGTTLQGGIPGFGTAFRMNPDGSGFTLLTSFENGLSPFARLLQATDGNLYGTTRFGGAGNVGAVFRIVLNCASDVTPPETTITSGPSGIVAGTAAIFTFAGSDNVTLPAGLTFEASLDGAAFTPVVSPKTYTGLSAGLHTFRVRAIDAAGNPDPTPATRNWTVGQTDPPCFETLKSFAFGDGTNPVSGLIQGADGALYGTTYLGANNDNSGTVFKLNPDGSGFAVLKYMDTPTSGGRPIAGLIQGTDGGLYGTAYLGGSNGSGTVFKLNPNGTGFTVLKHLDNATTGREPQGELVQGTDGALYGAAYLGGSSGFGTVFKLNPNGTGFTVLKHFDNSTTGGYLYGGLMQGMDGALYGTASQGGSSGFGTVFKLNPDGSGFTVLKHFDNTATGGTPYAGLMQGADGALYGMTYFGGSNGDGAIFKLNPDGSGFAVIKHLDAPTTGANPVGELIQGTDGALYGTAYLGGIPGFGTAFRLNPDGTGFTVLKSFEDNGAGTQPYARLLQATDGNLYGTTRFRGNNTGGGTIFRLVLNCNLDGAPPETTITAGPSGTVASAAATFTFTGSDNVTPPAGLTFEARLDGAPFAPATSPLNYTGFTTGSHTFVVRALDAAGNADPSPATRTWTVDLAPPETTITTGPDGVLADSAATFTFTGLDNLTPPAGLTFEVSLDGNPFTPVATTSVSYTGLAASLHTFRVRAIDAAGNIDPTPATSTWTVVATAVFSWGKNFDGQLGSGTTNNANIPGPVLASGALAGKTVTAIAGGFSHSVALTSDGKLFAWGRNAAGELGNGTTIGSLEPVAVDMDGVLAGKTVTALACGGFHTLVLTSDGRVFAWGDAVLGDGGPPNSPRPVAVIMNGALSGKTVTAIAASYNRSLALTSDGKIFGWGAPPIGDGTGHSRYEPAPVVMDGALTGKTVVAIAGANVHSVALTADGQVFTWGSNDFGQLGNGTTTESLEPVAVKRSGALAGKIVTAIAASGLQTMVLTSDGQVFCWGSNESGQLGDGSTTRRNEPVPVITNGALGNKAITAIVAGYSHAVALTSDGRLFAWGWNLYGQLGDGSTTQRNEPVEVNMDAMAGRSVIAIAGGGLHTLALTGVFPIDTWTTQTFGPDANNPAIAGKLANPDGDGFNNLLEYAFGTDPLSPGSSPPLGLSLEGGLLTLTFQQSVAATDIEFSVGETANLLTWTEPPFVGRILSDNGIMRTIQLGVPLSPGPAQFIQVRVKKTEKSVGTKGVSGL